MRAFHRASCISLLLGILTISSVGQTRSLTFERLVSPAGTGSAEPNIHVGLDGRVYLSWIEKHGDKIHALRFAVRSGGAWSATKTIVEGENLFVNWADFPSMVVLPDGALVAHWLVKSSPDAHAYDVNIARSTDDGKTWSKPLAPHRDGTRTEHGFASLFPLTGARAGAIWLDGRNFKKSATGDHGSSTNEMTLRYTTIDGKGQFSEDVLLDPRVCDCCQTSAAITSEGPIVVYRDRSDKEIRDISLVRLVKGRWTEPRTVSADGWEIHGCPVNGPSVSADGKRVTRCHSTGSLSSSAVSSCAGLAPR